MTNGPFRAGSDNPVQKAPGQYDAVLVVSFGGPNGPDDVMPFLENVLRGRPVPRERMLEVAEHYQHFGGRSPINEQNLALIAALRDELDRRGPQLPIYWGNRNWHPFLADTLGRMKADGVRRALALVTSGFSCYSGCRQYRENIAAASAAIGEGAPHIDKIRVFFNHPGFVTTMANHLRIAFQSLGPARGRRSVLFTAHSIPTTMADTSRYVEQLTESSRLVAEATGTGDWRLVYQSRSGPPTQPWLEPDVCDAIRVLHAEGTSEVILVPIGFISDHMEVLYDLDTEAAALCRTLGVRMARAATAGTAPAFIAMLRDLIAERHESWPDRSAVGRYPASHDVCPADCCPAPIGRPVAAATRQPS